MNKRGFTLIELIMVIVILGVLAAIALPKFYDLTDKAEKAAEAGVFGGIKAALAVYYANGLANGYDEASDMLWPRDLENVALGAGNDQGGTEVFGGILKDPVTKDASKGWVEIDNANDYTYVPTNAVYRYYPTIAEGKQGRFEKQAP